MYGCNCGELAPEGHLVSFWFSVYCSLHQRCVRRTLTRAPLSADCPGSYHSPSKIVPPISLRTDSRTSRSLLMTQFGPWSTSPPHSSLIVFAWATESSSSEKVVKTVPLEQLACSSTPATVDVLRDC